MYPCHRSAAVAAAPRHGALHTLPNRYMTALHAFPSPARLASLPLPPHERLVRCSLLAWLRLFSRRLSPRLLGDLIPAWHRFLVFSLLSLFFVSPSSPFRFSYRRRLAATSQIKILGLPSSLLCPVLPITVLPHVVSHD